MGLSASKQTQQDEKRRRVGSLGREGEASAAPVQPLGGQEAENEEGLNELQQIRFGFKRASGRPVEMKASALEAAARRLGDAKVAQEMMVHRRSCGLKSGAMRSSGGGSGPASDVEASADAEAIETVNEEKPLAVHKASGKPSITSEICRSLEQVKVGAAAGPPEPPPGQQLPGEEPIATHTAPGLEESYGSGPEGTPCLDHAGAGLALLGAATTEGVVQQPQYALPYASWPLVTLSTPSGPVSCFVEPGKEHLVREQMRVNEPITGKRFREELQ